MPGQYLAIDPKGRAVMIGERYKCLLLIECEFRFVSILFSVRPLALLT